MEVIIPEAEGTTHHSALPLRLGSAGSPDFGKEGGGCVAAGRLPALLKVRHLRVPQMWLVCGRHLESILQG